MCKNLSLTFVTALCVLHGAYAQIMGGVANLEVARLAPPPEAVLPPGEAVVAYSFFVLGYYIIPVIIGLSAFWAWKGMHEGRVL